MGDKKCQLEIVLFFIEDKQNIVEDILGIFKVVNENVRPSEMLALCCKSIKSTMPTASIVLITDHETNIHEGIDEIKIIRTNEIRHEYIMFDLLKYRKKYIEDALNSGKNIIFTDIDILFNKSIEEVFIDEFDVGMPATFYQNLQFSKRGVPINSLISTINCGIFFIKPNLESVEFYDAWINLMSNLNSTDELREYGALSIKIKDEFLKWWGEPHTLMVLINSILNKKEYKKFKFGNTTIKIMQDDIYNFTPEMQERMGKLGLSISREAFDRASVFHLRGGRKLFMRQLAGAMNIYK